MNAGSPLTPDVDLPGQEHDQANLDIVVEPEPDPDGAREEGAAADSSDTVEEPGAPTDDPEAGNTLIRPENS